MAEPAFRDEVERTRSVLVDLTTDLLAQNSVDERSREVLEVVATALVGAGEAVANRVAHQSMPTSVAAGVVVELAWRGLAGGAAKSPTRAAATASATTAAPTDVPAATTSATTATTAPEEKP